MSDVFRRTPVTMEEGAPMAGLGDAGIFNVMRTVVSLCLWIG